MNRYAISLILLATILATVITIPARADGVAAIQAAAAQRLQARVPLRFAKNTTLLSVVAVGRTVKYTLRLEFPKNRIPAAWYAAQRAKLIRDACTPLPVRKLIKEGASYAYLYTDINNRHVGEIRVRDADCPK